MALSPKVAKHVVFKKFEIGQVPSQQNVILQTSPVVLDCDRNPTSFVCGRAGTWGDDPSQGHVSSTKFFSVRSAIDEDKTSGNPSFF